MAKIRDDGQCAVCGTSGKVTLEHVPPRSCFPKPRPKPLPIYTCQTCNGDSSSEDEHLKTFLGATATNYSPKGKALKEGFIKTITHNKKLLRKILSGKLTDQVYDEHGKPKPDVVNLTWDMRSMIPLWNKMARCLYFHVYQEVLPQVVVMDQPILQKAAALDQRIAHLMQKDSVGNDSEFTFGLMRSVEGQRIRFHCQMLFWDRIRVDASGETKAGEQEAAPEQALPASQFR
jgi:hypothetical protein